MKTTATPSTGTGEQQQQPRVPLPASRLGRTLPAARVFRLSFASSTPQSKHSTSSNPLASPPTALTAWPPPTQLPACLPACVQVYGLEEQNWSQSALGIVVVGASGDLAKKKIFPALFALYYENMLPKASSWAGGGAA